MEQNAHVANSDSLLNNDSSSRKWTDGPKNGVGTSFYEPTMGPSLSNVWFTLANGILTEVFYPDVGTPNLLSLQFAISDERTFVDFEDKDMVHETRLAYEDALVYQQINTDKTGHYQLVKTYLTDPHENTLIIHIRMYRLSKVSANYQLFFALDSAVSGTPADDEVKFLEENEKTYLIAFDEKAAFAMASSYSIAIPERTFDPIRKKTSWILGLDSKDDSQDVNQNAREWTVCIGFGETIEKAIESCHRTISKPFDSILETYCIGWREYIKRFHPPRFVNHTQYLASLMIMKAHEDKIHPGAIVASLSTPWEPIVSNENPKPEGYHLVWARDLCHIASAFAIAGDTSIALRVLRYLDNELQDEDGSFPQNAWSDGTANWLGRQLDQTAYPILLAYQLSQLNCYETLVKPAADYLVAHGPATEQERWEENKGHSPSTMAAEIAALVVAAEMALKKNDSHSANLYITTADVWEQDLEHYVVTTKGKWSNNPYYIRISGTDNPNDGEWILIKNGGGWKDKTEVIDAGFLELVRLGIRKADNPLIIHSLSLVDKRLCYESSVGPVWKRYTYDGYGEYVTGEPYNGSGIGRPWPLLTGERGEYEIAWLHSEKTIRPKNWYGPVVLLQTLINTANDGFMIPEQIWDDKPVPNQQLFTDCQTHSASPLVWALAEYVRLAECIRQHRVVTMPSPVYRRYAGSSHCKSMVPVADFINDASCTLVDYPKNPVFCPGDFELKRICLFAFDDDIHFKIYLGHLDNPWDGPNGISKQIIDIYLNGNRPDAKKAIQLKGVNACFDSDTGWETLIRITGDWTCDTGIYSPCGPCTRGVLVFTVPNENLVHVIVKSDVIGGIPKSGWGISVIIAGEQLGLIRDVQSSATDWAFGRCFPHTTSLITDFLEPNKSRKLKRIRDLNCKVTEIPLICI